MAGFGADATGSYQTQNFVSPQAGVADNSAETLLKVGAGAVQQGFKIASAFKGKEFRGELDAAVNQEIGMKTLATQDVKPSDTEEFKGAIERAKQAYAQGGPGVKTRTTLLAEKLTREKAGANPLFANVYRQVAQEVLGDYDATLQFWTAAEEAAARQQESEMKGREKLVASVYRMHERAKGAAPLTFVPENGTDQQLQEYILLSSNIAYKLQDEERQRQAMKDARDARRTIATEQGAAAQTSMANIAMTKANIEGMESKHVSSIQSAFDPEFDSGVQELLAQIADGKVSTISPEFRAEMQRRISVIRSRYNQMLNTADYETELGYRRAGDFRGYMEGRFKELEALVNGPFSDLKAAADQSSYMKSRLGIKSMELAGPLHVLTQAIGSQGAGMVINDLINDNPEILPPELRTEYAESLKGILASSSQKQQNGGDMSGLPDTHASYLRRKAIDRAASTNPQDASVLSTPREWGTNFVTATDAIEVRGPTLSGGEIGNLLKGAMTRDFIKQYEAVQREDPSQAIKIADRYHDAARYVLPSSIKTILKKTENVYMNPENGYLVTDLPDPQVRTLINQINGVLDGLVATKRADRTAPQDDNEARLYFIQEYFK